MWCFDLDTMYAMETVIIEVIKMLIIYGFCILKNKKIIKTVIGHKQKYCQPCAILIKFETLCKDARVREREAISMNLLEAEIRVWKWKSIGLLRARVRVCGCKSVCVRACVCVCVCVWRIQYCLPGRHFPITSHCCISTSLDYRGKIDPKAICITLENCAMSQGRFLPLTDECSERAVAWRKF